MLQVEMKMLGKAPGQATATEHSRKTRMAGPCQACPFRRTLPPVPYQMTFKLN
jgi:hypothetical protein